MNKKKQVQKRSSSSPHKLISQNASSAKNAGRYGQVVHFTNTVLSPGDSFEIRYFISGYGYIDYKSAKLYYSTSSEIVDEQNSTMFTDFLRVGEFDVAWGGAEWKLSNSGIVQLNGDIIEVKQGLLLTFFDDFVMSDSTKKNIDLKKSNNVKFEKNDHPEAIIYSETNSGSAGKFPNQPPILFHVKLRDNLRPGNYLYSFLFTYFNGESWQNDKVEIPIKVENWFERNDRLIKYMALIISILTIVSMMLTIPNDILNLVEEPFDTKKSAVIDSIDSKNPNFSSEAMERIKQKEKKIKPNVKQQD